MNSEQGYILILTLCITALMSLLWLSNMQHLLLFQQASNRAEEQHQRFYQLEFLARSLIKMPLKKHSGCRFDLNNYCEIKLQDQQYQYQVEDLGEYPCLVTQKNGKLTSTHHYRFTLKDNRSTLEIRVMKPSTLPYCDQKIKPVIAGISSWRFLPNGLKAI